MRLPESGTIPNTDWSWQELFVNADRAAAASSVAQSVASSDSLLIFDAFASDDECRAIAVEALGAADNSASVCQYQPPSSCIRRHVTEVLGANCLALSDQLLLRQVTLLRWAAPSLTDSLFGGMLRSSPFTCMYNKSLAWTEGEPAINIYTDGGCFTPHIDEQALTFLLNLSPESAYTGGGTAFWSRKDAGADLSLTATNLPSHVIRPAAGTALVFGGMMAHAAQPVITGVRLGLGFSAIRFNACL